MKIIGKEALTKKINDLAVRQKVYDSIEDCMSCGLEIGEQDSVFVQENEVYSSGEFMGGEALEIVFEGVSVDCAAITDVY